MNQQQALEMCRNMTASAIQQGGIPRQSLIRFGQMAMQATKNPRMKQALYQEVINSGLIDRSELPKGLKTDDLAMLVVMGKMAEQMQGL